MVSYFGFRSEVLMITHQNSFGILKNHWWEFFTGDDQWLSDQVCNSPNFIFSTSFWIANTSGCWGWQLSTIGLSNWQLWQRLILKIMLWLLWITIILVIFSSYLHLNIIVITFHIKLWSSGYMTWLSTDWYIVMEGLRSCGIMKLIKLPKLVLNIWHLNICQNLSQMLNIWTSIQVDGFQNRYFAF